MFVPLITFEWCSFIKCWKEEGEGEEEEQEDCWHMY
jgi:hypothetical protein